MRQRLLEKHPLMEEAGDGAGSATGTPPPAASGDSPADWRSSLPPHQRELASIQDIKDVPALVDAFTETKGLVGRSFRLPSEEASVEDITKAQQTLLEKSHLGLMRKPDMDNPDTLTELYTALGRPEEAAGYEAPEGVDGDAFDSMRGVAHELGLTRKQFETLASKQFEGVQAAMQQHEEQRQAGVNEVKKDWGPSFDERVARAAKTAEALDAPQEVVEAIRNGQANAATLKMFNNVAERLGSEGTAMASQIGTVTAESTAEIQDRINDRTNRIIQNPTMGQAEKQRLIQANLRDTERLAKAS